MQLKSTPKVWNGAKVQFPVGQENLISGPAVSLENHDEYVNAAIWSSSDMNQSFFIHLFPEGGLYIVALARVALIAGLSNDSTGYLTT